MNGCTPGKRRRGRTGGGGAGGVGPARGVTGRTWCAAPCKPLFLRRRAPRLPGLRRRQRAGRGASLPANPYSFVAEHHVFCGQGAGNGPDVVRRSPQTLIPSSPSTTSSGAKAPETGRTWCVAHRKPLFLRRRAPRLPEPRRRQRVGRGAPLPANSYSFVTEHHVFRGQSAGNGAGRIGSAGAGSAWLDRRGWTGARGNRPDVVRRSLQTLIPSSPSTTSSVAKAPATGRTWCAAHRKPLFLRRRAPRLPRLRRRENGAGVGVT